MCIQQLVIIRWMDSCIPKEEEAWPMTIPQPGTGVLLRFFLSLECTTGGCYDFFYPSTEKS
jgi:hypothetical protein